MSAALRFDGRIDQRRQIVLRRRADELDFVRQIVGILISCRMGNDHLACRRTILQHGQQGVVEVLLGSIGRDDNGEFEHACLFLLLRLERAFLKSNSASGNNELTESTMSFVPDASERGEFASA